MKRTTHSRTRLALACAILIVAVVGLTSCDGEADHWLVIHDRASAVPHTGGDWTACDPPPPGDKVAFLPGCLDVDKNDKIGFVNYSNTDVEIRHFGTLDASNDPFQLPKGSEKIFKVTVEGQRVLFDIKSTISHGGPEMIIRP